VQAVESKVLSLHVQNVDLQDHKEEKGMGEVIALIRLMPDGVLEDEKIQKIMDDIKTVIQAPVKLGKVEVKNIAFGLKGVDVTVAVPDSEGGVDPVVETLSKIDNVDNVEVVDVGRI
jgi:translation elongation factor aEF-1 beta